MIHKEDIDKELNESEAIIKQQQVKIEETKKYTETLNTCKNVLNQIKELSGVITENQKILNDNMGNFSHDRIYYYKKSKKSAFYS